MKRFIIAVFVLGLLFTAAIPSFASSFNFYYPNSFVSTDEYAEGVGYTMNVTRTVTQPYYVSDLFGLRVDGVTRQQLDAGDYNAWEEVEVQGEAAYNPNLSTHTTIMFWQLDPGKQAPPYGWNASSGHCWGYEYL